MKRRGYQQRARENVNFQGDDVTARGEGGDSRRTERERKRRWQRLQAAENDHAVNREGVGSLRRPGGELHVLCLLARPNLGSQGLLVLEFASALPSRLPRKGWEEKTAQKESFADIWMHLRDFGRKFKSFERKADIYGPRVDL